ncbi:hypothetical protein B4U79_16652 [Dinothrombium tinctorium]|uniref:Uncharacterized protein n=1 Tax=Dinothrombium tinctorium TaxID=1965070 RepID=A0A3S3P6H0_9ACAR|nr:hypothetical protein B4U79_16652 [Dinothrombium tinctorium]
MKRSDIQFDLCNDYVEIDAMAVNRRGEIFVFALEYVIKFKAYTELDYETNSFWRLENGYPKRLNSNVFPKFRGRVKSAAIDESGNILLYANGSAWIYENERTLKFEDIKLDALENNPSKYKHPIFKKVKREAFKSAENEYDLYDIEHYTQSVTKRGTRFGYISSCYRKRNDGRIETRAYYFVDQMLSLLIPGGDRCYRRVIQYIYYYELKNGTFLGFETDRFFSKPIIMNFHRNRRKEQFFYTFTYTNAVIVPTTMKMGV